MFIDETQKREGRCDGCKHCKRIYANGGWSFYGCYHSPYRGKWVANIKECPKEAEKALERREG